MGVLLSVLLFVVGVVVVVWATERLLEGLVGLARLVRVSTFAIAVVLSGFEAENVAVGLAAARGGEEGLALGTVFGGATFLICVALGGGALLYPLRVRLPAGFIVLLVACPVATGIGIAGGGTHRLTGALLMAGFVGAVWYLISASRGHTFLESEEVRESLEEQVSRGRAVWMTVLGLVVIAAGGEMISEGAAGIVGGLGVSELLVGMVVAPAAIELEEVIRQAVPAKEGRPEVAAGNLVGTLLYFLWFNLALISLIFPVEVPVEVVTFEWPYLVGVSLLAAIFLARGRVGRVEGTILLGAYGVYLAAHLFYL